MSIQSDKPVICEVTPCGKAATARMTYAGKVFWSANLCDEHRDEAWKLAHALSKAGLASVSFTAPAGRLMPSKSKKQHNFMAMCAHNPGAAKGKCPPKKVAKEYVKADKAKSRKK